MEAILADKWGAANIRAIDTDLIAICPPDKTSTANGVADKIKAQVGSLDTLLASGEKFDVALVNILAKVIIMMCGQGLGGVLRTGGVAVFGGIIQEQADEVEAALRSTGLTPYKRR